MTFLEEIRADVFTQKHLRVFVLRLDKIHPITGGNKYFKLKYNLIHAKESGLQKVLSFGGAYSNHIAALAAAAKEHQLQAVGVIRGNELNVNSNRTLKEAAANGMELAFVDRDTYTNKATVEVLGQLKERFGPFCLIPEGGSNALAIKGCKEIVDWISPHFDYLISACGTGGTIGGAALALKPHQRAIGIPVLKGAEFLVNDIEQLQMAYISMFQSSEALVPPQLIYDYHFGGYAKVTEELLSFKAEFEKNTSIPLDKIYTAKCFFALYDLAQKDFFPEDKTIVVLHTGGLQGNQD